MIITCIDCGKKEDRHGRSIRCVECSIIRKRVIHATTTKSKKVLKICACGKEYLGGKVKKDCDECKKIRRNKDRIVSRMRKVVYCDVCGKQTKSPCSPKCPEHTGKRGPIKGVKRGPYVKKNDVNTKYYNIDQIINRAQYEKKKERMDAQCR